MSLLTLKKSLLNVCEGDGFNLTSLDSYGVFKLTSIQKIAPSLYKPFICLMVEGEKCVSVGDYHYNYSPGEYFINLLPTPVVSEIKSASIDNPMLVAVLEIDLMKLAGIAIEIKGGQSNKIVNKTQSSMLTGQATKDLIDTFLRLTNVSEGSQYSRFLGELYMDEVYYHILTGVNGERLRSLFSNNKDIYPIANTVQYIQNNFDKQVSVEHLLEVCNMGRSRFFDSFKELMHISPLQYLKSYRLQRAHILLTEGLSSNEVCYRVGYKNYSQFSREYKRYIGFSPSVIAQ